jgi:hypothetical protein
MKRQEKGGNRGAALTFPTALTLIVFMLLAVAGCEKKGGIEVNSVPQGAAIWLDSANTGHVTNCVLTDISPGIHCVKLTRNGFWDYECRVSVFGGQNAVVNVTLDSGSARSYYPLAQGDSWTYVVNTVTTVRREHDTTYDYTDTLWKTALAETAYMGTVWRVQNQHQGQPSMQYILDSDSEVVLYPPPDLIGCPFRFLLHMPLAENATWVAEWGENGQQPPRQIATVRSHGSLTVPAGMLDDVWQVDYVDTCASETTRTGMPGESAKPRPGPARSMCPGRTRPSEPSLSRWPATPSGSRRRRNELSRNGYLSRRSVFVPLPGSSEPESISRTAFRTRFGPELLYIGG